MEALLAQDPAGKARLEKTKRRLARYAEFKDEQQLKRSLTDDVENFDPGAAASAASGAGAASKAAAGHGTPAVAQQAEGCKEESLKRTAIEVQPDAWNPG